MNAAVGESDATPSTSHPVATNRRIRTGRIVITAPATHTHTDSAPILPIRHIEACLTMHTHSRVPQTRLSAPSPLTHTQFHPIHSHSGPTGPTNTPSRIPTPTRVL